MSGNKPSRSSRLIKSQVEIQPWSLIMWFLSLLLCWNMCVFNDSICLTFTELFSDIIQHWHWCWIFAENSIFHIFIVQFKYGHSIPCSNTWTNESSIELLEIPTFTLWRTVNAFLSSFFVFYYLRAIWHGQSISWI